MSLPISWPMRSSRVRARSVWSPWRRRPPTPQEAIATMSDRLLVTIDPRPTETRILVMDGLDERMRAVLSPSVTAHPRAAATLLEGLSLWHQMPLCVALCVDDGVSSSALHLYDALGEGTRNVHFEVGLVVRERRGRGRRLPCLGRFGDLRQLTLEGVVR